MDKARINRMLKQLSESELPSRDLWPGIERRISGVDAAGSRAERRTITIAALSGAAAALLVVVGAAVFYVAFSGGGLPIPSQPGYAESLGVPVGGDPSTQVLADELDRAELRYRSARSELDAILNELADTLGDDPAITDLRDQFAAMDRSVDLLVEAIRTHPSVGSIHNLAVYYGAQARSMERTSLYVQDLRL